MKDKGGGIALHIAVRGGHFEVVKLLLEHKGFDVDADDNEGWTPLYHAAEYGHPKMIKQLVASKARIPSQSIIGTTPLHIAARESYLPFVRFLVSVTRKAKANMGEEQGRSAFTIAVYHGRIATVRKIPMGVS